MFTFDLAQDRKSESIALKGKNAFTHSLILHLKHRYSITDQL